MRDSASYFRIAPWVALLLALGCADGERALRAATGAESATEVPGNPQKDAYFGDLHVHSAWSLDAWAFGVRVTPEDAYRYARGQAIEHVSGRKIRLMGAPLDFVALTEHANYLGFSEWLEEGSDPGAAPQLLRDLVSSDRTVARRANEALFADMALNIPVAELLVPEAAVANTWRRIVELADRNNLPGEFSAFVAYEYTPMPEGQNLHRNVVFRGSRVPERPFSSLESMNPEDLWDWMDAVRGTGSDVLAIPHNQNGSNGRMYEAVNWDGAPIDAGYATQRVRNEPVSEVMQIKGQSEAHPELSPDDEWADFEIAPAILGLPNSIGKVPGSYARQALRDGLAIEARTGVNPYRFGMLGSSDGHNASSPVEEENYTGKIGFLDGTPEARLGRSRLWGGAAGLTGVWAAANTREAIFDAMRAREVFSTSGPRLRVRLFGGWDFAEADLGQGMVASGYERGVAMGGVLRGDGHDAGAPTLLVGALKDPNGAPLERLQIVKGWLDGGQTFEKVFDVACADGSAPEGEAPRCAARAAAPDLDDCSFDAKGGRDQLSAAWTDPEFESGQACFYYARVLQVPTCRWSTHDAKRLGVPLPEDVPAAIQERAVTSPVWYAP
ncbi:MAG: DUF3604 domain-containing protein [Deltaproteobacteria bacterium]|nr:DUF3604 domain-containing protein [Deltaproteobacteria bacterium]MBW2359275.1 DUF3604 domain-containing protein [Deltaproteobacteria bacterium]